MNAVDIENLSFSYGNIRVFDNLNLSISKGSFVTILGKGASGKSTLFKILCGELKYDGNILISNKSINYNINKGYLGFVSADIYNFKEKRVIDELVRVLQDKGKIDDRIKDEIDRVTRKTGIKDILDSNISDLSVKDRVLLLFTIQILNRPRVLIIDNALEYLDSDKDKIVKEIMRLNRKSTTVINISNNTEECLYGKKIVILGDGVQCFEVSKVEEEQFLNNEIDAPFMISLSSRLKFYGLVSENYLSMEKLVDKLWQ